jgi:hypothetical protein
MQRFFKVTTLFAMLVIIIFTITFSGACRKPELPTIPYLSPEYYNCLEAIPSELVSAYFSNYGNMAHSESELNKRYFVFKNQMVQDWTIKEMDQGWIWLEGNVKCVLVNNNGMNNFKIGDKVDVVGYNMGVISYSAAGLWFKDCVVMPAGTVKLPSIGGAFAGGY